MQRTVTWKQSHPSPKMNLTKTGIMNKTIAQVNCSYKNY